MFDEKMKYYWGRIRRYGKKYPGFHWPSAEVLLNLVYAYDVVAAHFARRIGKYGLSLSTFNVLILLSRSETAGMKQQELSKLLLVSRANVTGLVNSLIRRGLVKRHAHESDRRACLVTMTQSGEKLLEAILPDHYREGTRVASVLKAAEKKELSKLLTKLRSGFKRIRDEKK